MHARHELVLVLLGSVLAVPQVRAQEPVQVEGVEVTAPAAASIPAEMVGFYKRRESGFGHFLTRAQIERQQARRLTDLLESVPGVRIVPTTTRMGMDYVVQMGRSMNSRIRSCPVLYFLNGIHFEPSLAGMNAEVRPDEIEGIEVYSGASQIPALFNSSGFGSACGVIAIWTRHGR